MAPTGMRVVTLAGVAIMVFLIAVILLVNLLPGPRMPGDYLIIGSVATLVALAVLFAMVIPSIVGNREEMFFKKRRRQ
ncbi:MAG: hypothetical protein ACKV22_05965 [Bryobacteraceae bacterium]